MTSLGFELVKFLLAVAPAALQAEESPLARGMRHYWNGEYELTVQVLSPACARESNPGEALECHKYLAFSWVALGDDERARDAFVALLSSDPGHRLEPELVAPKIVKRFDDAAGHLADVWFAQGKEEYFRERFEEAVELLDNVLALDSEHELAREYRQLSGERLELSARLTPLSPEPPPVEPAEDPGRVYHLNSEITRPVQLQRVEPVYPRAALLRRKEGEVVLSVVIDATGAVTNPNIIRAVDDFIDRAAVEAVLQWRYQPALLKGRPVSVYAVIQIRFALED